MSETENESSPRFNKAIIGRIGAVAVFVALGTFAVVQSVKSKPAAVVVEPGAETPERSEGEDSIDDDGAKDVKKDGKDGFASDKPATTNPRTRHINKLGSSFSSQPKLPTATQNLKLPKTSDFSPPGKSNALGAFGAKAAGSANNAFPKSPTSSNPGSINQPKLPVVVAKTQNKPPERFAQAPGGPPIIGSNKGFQSRPTVPPAKSTVPPATPKGLPATSTVPPVNPNRFSGPPANPLPRNVLNNAQSTTNGFKTDVQDSANELLKQAGKKSLGIAGTTKSQVNNFSPKPKPPIGLAGPPPAKAFVPPAIQSGFGSKTSNSKSSPASNSVPSQKNSTTPDNSSFISSKNPAPPTSSPAKSNFGSQPGARNTSSPVVNSSQLPGKQTGAPGTASSPFGNLNVTSSSRSNAPVAPLRAPTSTNQQPSNPSAFPKSSLPSSSDRPISRLDPGNTALPADTTNLAKATPGDRQLEGVQAAALTVEKLSPREIQVDQAADFQLVIKNVGRASAEDVRVFDIIPQGTEFLGASPEPTRQSRSGEIQWSIGKLRPGQEKRIKLQLKPTRPGELGSVAHVSFSTQASMRTLVTKPVLEVTHQSKPTHLIGDDVILDVIVKNKGDGPAKNVLIQEDVPQQLEFQDGYRELEYSVGTLMPGQSRRIQLALKAAQVGKLRNVMFASADGGLKTKHELPMEIVSPKLVVQTDGPTRRFLQRNATHQFIVANNGTAPATNVELVAHLPSGLRFLTANNQGRYDASAHSVYWSLAELARGVEAKVELKTMPIEVGNQPIKFESFADLEVKANAEQPLSVEHLVDVFFDIDDVVDPIEIGSSTSYRVRVVNQGTKAATNVQLQVDFPPGLKPTAVDGSLRHNINQQRIEFEPINSLTPGDQISIVIHGEGQSAGDHRVIVSLRADGRQTQVSKEETTRVYSDR